MTRIYQSPSACRLLLFEIFLGTACSSPLLQSATNPHVKRGPRWLPVSLAPNPNPRPSLVSASCSSLSRHSRELACCFLWTCSSSNSCFLSVPNSERRRRAHQPSRPATPSPPTATTTTSTRRSPFLVPFICHCRPFLSSAPSLLSVFPTASILVHSTQVPFVIQRRARSFTDPAAAATSLYFLLWPLASSPPSLLLLHLNLRARRCFLL